MGGADVSGCRQHKGERVLGGGNGVAGRGVHHDHAVIGGGFAIDVVNTDARTSDGFEIGSGGEDLAGDFGLGANHETVILTDDFFNSSGARPVLTSTVMLGVERRASTPFSEMGSETRTR